MSKLYFALIFTIYSCSYAPVGMIGSLIPTSSDSEQTSTQNVHTNKAQANKAAPIDPKLLQLSKETMIIETRHGVISLKFYPNAAPKTAARISELVKSGFYNGLKFHRVIPNFVAQGGDPLGNGTGGSGVKIPAEFNPIPHEPGTLSMARWWNDPNSADSQFYICLNRLEYLDNNYTVFGKVISGMDAVYKIKPNDLMEKVYLK